ncbi:hypothetical protein IL54_4733 [Sphingobium sp. ba1]|nr:hypothetical protein IL54_4733 [Sphingobium sp. ba1]
MEIAFADMGAETGDRVIARPVMAKMAFEQGKAVDRKGRAGQGGVAGEERVEQAAAPTKARQRDMRSIGAAFGRQADGDAGAIDLAVQAGEGITRFDPSPEGVDHALAIEDADPRDPDVEGRKADEPKRIDKVVGAMAIHFADEAQGEMELGIALPPGSGHARHDGEQRGAMAGRRADGDEQAMHKTVIAISERPRQL